MLLLYKLSISYGGVEGDYCILCIGVVFSYFLGSSIFILLGKYETEPMIGQRVLTHASVQNPGFHPQHSMIPEHPPSILGMTLPFIK